MFIFSLPYAHPSTVTSTYLGQPLHCHPERCERRLSHGRPDAQEEGEEEDDGEADFVCEERGAGDAVKRHEGRREGRAPLVPEPGEAVVQSKVEDDDAEEGGDEPRVHTDYLHLLGSISAVYWVKDR